MILRMIAVLFLISSCHAREAISNDQAIILNTFFRFLFEETELGYVFYGEKPICMLGFLPKDNFSVEDDFHKSMVITKLGIETLKKLNNKSTELMFQVSTHENTCGYHEFIMINRSAFLKTITENIHLYRYILGPSVTPEFLLTEMLNPANNFSSVLNNNEVLVGITLGYYPQNSIHHTRLLEIENNLLSDPIPPFKSELMKRNDVRPIFLHGALIGNKGYHARKELKPFKGDKSLNEEFKRLNQQLCISSEKLETCKPCFIFGHINDLESAELVKRLEICQDKIQALLKSETFLEEVLSKIFPDVDYHHQPISHELKFDDQEKVRIPYLVAATMWDDIHDENSHFQQAFVEGCKACHQGIKWDPTKSENKEYRRLLALKKIHERLKATNHYFEQINADPSWECVVLKKLYRRKIEEGSGNQLKNQHHVKVRYVCKNSRGEVLSDSFCSEPKEIDLLDMIPGFSVGVKGMKIGEICELVIHPTLTYGVLTPAEKGDYLYVRVQLLDFDITSSISEHSNLVELEIPSYSEDKYNEESKKNGYGRGYKAWEHYKKANLNLDEVLGFLEQFRKGKVDDNSDVASQNMMNRLHWNLYLTQ